MKVCKNCVHWSKQLKGTCKLNNYGVGQYWQCSRWMRMSDLPAQDKLSADKHLSR